MRFAPKSAEDIEKEAAARGPWQRGEYDFEIVFANDTTSKAGNDMIELELHVFNADAERRTVKDWLLEAMAAKLRHAAEACGLHAEYDSGDLAAHHFMGRTGKLKLGIQRNPGFPDRNNVQDYVPAASPRAAPRPAATRAAPARAPEMAHVGRPDLDDEIPF